MKYRCSVIQSVWLFVTPWSAACQVSLSLTICRSCTNSRPLSQCCHPTILSSVIPFFSCLQSFPASGSFPVSQLLASGGQSMGASASASVLPMNIQDWFPLGLTGWISLQSKDSQESSPTLQFKSNNSSALSLFYGPTLIPIHDWTHTPNHTGKTIVLTRWTFVGKVMSLLLIHCLDLS